MSALICYLDILGFSDSIKLQNSDELDRTFKSLESASQFFDAVIIDQKIRGTTESKLNLEFLHLIKIEIFNDSILIIADFPKKSLARNRWGDDAATKHFIELFLMGCSYVYIQIFCELGLLSRGSVVFGSYKKIKKERFSAILSPDVIEAILLEKKANYPRVIIGDSLINHCKSIKVFGSQLYDNHFFEDEDKCICLDVYKDVIFNSNAEIQMKFNKAYDSLLVKCFSKEVIDKIDWFRSYIAKRKIREVNN